MTNSIDLNHYLSEKIRTAIEQRYYARINEQARLEVASLDPEFLRDPRNHTALFSDHGVVHVRDVATKMVTVLEAVHGILIPARPRHRLAFMQGYGVIMAYLHDIGMVDFSRYGRAIHPEYASQHVFKMEFDPVLETIWLENWGNVAWRLTKLATDGALTQPPQEVLRELLSLSNCHSKSKVPIEVANDRIALRKHMQISVATDLRVLYQQQQIAKLKRALSQESIPTDSDSTEEVDQLEAKLLQAESTLAELWTAGVGRNKDIERYYRDFHAQSFQWLESTHPDVETLINDVIDTLRILRCADALRQRGEVLKTSGSYEIFVDQNSGNAIYALRYNDDELYLLELAEPISAGEANMSSSELDNEGNLRISFHRGRFVRSEVTQRAAYASAAMVNDVQLDVIDSFYGVEASLLKSVEDMQILLEETEDNPYFVELVLSELIQLNPAVANRVQIVPCLNEILEQERDRYLKSPRISWDVDKRCQILTRISESGHKTESIDPELCFKDVKLVELAPGDILVEAGAPARFVYIPLDQGLCVYPLGGYQPFRVRPWMPLGNTGVIRGAVRNATIVAEQPLRLLIIPKTVYLRYWHHTYTKTEFVNRLQAKNNATLI